MIPRSIHIASAALLALTLMTPVTLFAQPLPPEDPVADAPMHFGALGLGPKVTLVNLGVDSNVFHEADDPKEDFTFTVAPSLDLWLRTARGILTTSGRVEFVYFNTYESERSINGFGSVQYEYRFNRLRPYVFASWLDTRERPGFEIDARARRFETAYKAGADIRTGSKSDLTLAARRTVYEFAGDEVFNGQALNQQLNRTLEGIDAGWRQRLTVLTTWQTTVSYEQERFEFDDFRNADSVRALTGFELARLALIRGSAYVGYRRFSAAEGGVLPEFSGVVAETDIFYTAPSRTRLGLGVDRDLQYSYEDQTPYYVLTSLRGSVTQRLVGRWDVQVQGGRNWLSYRGLASSDTIRTDTVDDVGGGIGYQLSEETRLSFDAVSSNRQSEVPGLDYRAVRYGLNATYVF